MDYNDASMKYVFSFIALVLLAAPALVRAQDCPLAVDTAYRAPNSSAVWYVTPACEKKAFKNAKLFFSYFDDFSATVVDSKINRIPVDEISWMAWGPKYDPKYGAVVKTLDDPKVYFLLGDKKYWIEDEYAFTQLGYKWNWIEDVDARLLAKYGEGKALNAYDGHPQYTLLKYADAPEVYRLEPHPLDHRKTLKRHITSQRVFTDLGYRLDRIVVIDKNVLSTDDTYVVDTLSMVLLGEPITTVADARTPMVPIIPYPTRGHSPQYVRYHEPIAQLQYELPRSWEIRDAQIEEARTLSIEASNDFIDEVEREQGMLMTVSPNSLNLTQQEANDILLGVFTWINESKEENITNEKKLEEIFAVLLAKYHVSSFDELDEEQRTAVANMLINVALFSVILPEVGKHNIVDVGGYREVFEVSLSAEGEDAQDPTKHHFKFYYLFTKDHAVTVLFQSNENDEAMFTNFVETFFTHMSFTQ